MTENTTGTSAARPNISALTLGRSGKTIPPALSIMTALGAVGAMGGGVDFCGDGLYLPPFGQKPPTPDARPKDDAWYAFRAKEKRKAKALKKRLQEWRTLDGQRWAHSETLQLRPLEGCARDAPRPDKPGWWGCNLVGWSALSVCLVEEEEGDLVVYGFAAGPVLVAEVTDKEGWAGPFELSW